MNDIRIIPIYFYPFTRTQNQILDNINLFRQGLGASDSEHTSVNYHFNWRFGKAVGYDDTTILDDSPIIKGHTPLGEVSFSVDLSMQSFSQLFTTDTKLINKTIYDIKMLVFFKDYLDIKLEGIDKYFYYVENIVRKNANVYTFTLSLDVFKTYYHDILKIKNVVPERYFISSEDLKRTLTQTDDDLLLPGSLEVGNTASPEYFWNNAGVINSTRNEVMSFEYFYIKGNNRQSGATILDPYTVIVIANGGSSDNLSLSIRVRKMLYEYEGLLKVVSSPISPTDSNIYPNEKYIFDNGTSIMLNPDSNIIYPMGDVFEMVPYTMMQLYNDQLKDYLRDVGGIENFGFVLKTHNRPQETDLYVANGTKKLEYRFNDYFNRSKYLSGDFSQTAYKPIMSIGFYNEPKKIIPLYSNVSIKLRLEHSLFESKDVIIFEGDNNIESSISRSSEFTNPQLTDAYTQYLYNNKNALEQKELELGRYATRNTWVGGIVRTVVAGLGVAGAVATGGGSLAVAGGIIAGGMSTYNTIESLGKNARARAMHNAELQDKKGVIENFTPSKYNEKMDRELMLPIVQTFVNDYKGLDNFFSYKDNNSIYDIINMGTNESIFNLNNLKRYGLKFSGTKQTFRQEVDVEEMMTRYHYNYIEVADTTNAIQNGNIPNILYNHVLEVLRAGITYSSIDYILDSNIKNGGFE